VTLACHELRLQCAAYADDELGVDAALEVERHLVECAACRRVVGRQRHLSRALRELYPIGELPAGLEGRTRFALFGPTSVRGIAVAGAVVAALAGVSGYLASRADRAPAFPSAPAHDARPGLDPLRSDARVADPAPAVVAAATLHRDVDAGTRGLELATTDVAAVNAWLRERLPFAGAIGKPGSDAIRVSGAARVMLGEHPAALVRYRTAAGTISLFVIDEPVWSEGAPPVRVGNVDFRIFQRRGLDVIGWSHASISYLLVSEDGLTTGEACAACHGEDARGSIGQFVTAVAGHGAGTGVL
jgi:anti-sigma factor RsiW